MGQTDICYVDRLPSVVEDDAYGVPQTAADAADAMPEIDAIVAFRTLDRPVVHGEGHRIALSQRYHLGPALHAWPLLGQDKLAACEIAFGFREQDCNLQRECEVAVKILMQAVEVARHVLQQQRRWPRLTLDVTCFRNSACRSG
jgi:hypothetical protein